MMSEIMPDDDKPKGPDFADLARQRFEEARREFEDEEPEQKKPAGDAGKPDGKPKTLRVVPLPKPEPWAAPTWLPTGEAVVAEFMRKHGEDFFYVDAEGAFYHWVDNRTWRRDECRTVPRLMGELCCLIGKDKKKSVRDRLESSKFIGGAAGRVRDKCARSADCLDVANLMCTPEAAWPLELPLTPRPHRREDYCTKMTAVSAVKGACPTWLAFLDQVTANDHDLRDYLQRCAGYWMTPFVSEQTFWFLYGGGGNGKGFFLRTIKRVLGNYATNASLDLFLATKFEQHSEELASLRAIRFVMATETEKGRAWNESKIKALTGGDSIRARFMRQNSFEYDPQFKIVVSGNEKPSIKSVDAAMRRRLQLVPFEVDIPKAQQNDAVELRMFREEGPAILAWMFEGFEQWREHGLAPPEKVVAASEEYFLEQDTMQEWIGERCETGNPNFFEFSNDLYQDWKRWCDARGYRYGSQTQFSVDLKKKHFEAHHSYKGNGFYGIRLKKPDQEF